MKFLLQRGDYYNIPVATYYAESEEELEEFENVPVGSKGLILTEEGLVVKMYRSTGWVSI